MANKNVPALVKVLSVLYIIGAVVMVISGILLLVGAGFIGAYADQIAAAVPGGGGLMAAVGTAALIILGVLIIAFAVLCFFVGRGLWKAKSWARVTAIVLAIIGLLFAILGMAGGNISGNLFSLVINALIGGYLLFAKSVKDAFA